eukprot:CAMPEP_0174300084 /NCGR_PEP_ID=MMETSP0809-20121228/58261_1 /TAXON_ID=73025 ORGANISM="Eutreptiella gymnastica-like, Strain CCMP1594" /NCGR_SAMPLE_ID=MMETSP0809 /ASSEMBLY_ACC=CAM_ASM_000658 /LENGTH=833 /DNA_ID=CAMNT_0015405617 /DNA_START=163 /DNA_END=2664 /DNA_ORIENTATION=+
MNSSIEGLQSATSSSLDSLQNTTTNSIRDLGSKIQQNFLTEALATLNVRITEGDKEMDAQVLWLKAIGGQQMDHRSNVTTLAKLNADHNLNKRNFITMSAHPYFSFIMQSGVSLQNGPDEWGVRTWWVTWQALNFDFSAKLFTGTPTYTRTLYYSDIAMNQYQNGTTMRILFPSQTTGDTLFPMQNNPDLPPAAFMTKNAGSGWADDLSFSEYSGQVEVNAWQWIEAANNTWMQVIVSLNTQTISQELKGLLTDSPKDRLFMFFRRPHGHMIAASHGIFHSESARDLSKINPIENPPKVSEWKMIACNISTDVVVREACEGLYKIYGGWDRIPALNTEMTLNGSRYWVDVGHSSSKLNFTVVMLKDRASVMGPIEESQAAVLAKVEAENAKVAEEINDKKTLTYVILSIATVLGVMAPLIIGLWLGSKLVRLASRMDEIATLQFRNNSIDSSNFTEIDKFQKSFMQMSNGLQAFGKFVPAAVVKVLVTGSMKASDQMVNRELTVLFADIESFSTISETISPEDLVAVCTPYFEKMCRQIIKRNGCIDKFIGDCIMAMWNAPVETDGHEIDAIASGLAMQDSIQAAHAVWTNAGLPILKFRAGIHSGPCLVGNFGCSHRVAYTCLGDTVNLASRLEALNKKFGSYLMCSDATYQKSKSRFHFRMLAKVTVPGKSEIVPIYEVLALRRGLPELRRPSYSNTQRRDKSPDPSPRPQALSYEKISTEIHVQEAGDDDVTVMVMPNSVASSEDKAAMTVYHWKIVSQAALLDHGAVYEEAYQALNAGRLVEAKNKLATNTEFTATDVAWAALTAQYERQVKGNLPQWDGVFYFEHKED